MAAAARKTAASFVMRQGWYITKGGLQTVLSVATIGRENLFAEARRQALEARGGAPLDNTRSVTVRNGVATIPIDGPLVRHASMFDEISGAASYEDIRKDLQAAFDSPDVRSIVLSMNSPGGEVTGCGELADAIFALRGQGKKLIAYVGGMACSACYWLASACDEIVCAPTAELGSIGCVLAFLDDKEALAEEGFKEIKFISSQSPLKHIDPASEDGKNEYQLLVNDLAGVFVDSVARNRGVSANDVLENYGKGGVMVGARAVTAGLADRLGSLEAVLAELGANETPAANAPMKRNAYMNEEQKKKIALALGLSAEASAEEMHGAVVSAVESHSAIGPLRAQFAELKAASSKHELRALLEQGISSGKLSLGQIQSTVPLFVANEEHRAKMLAAFDAIEETTAQNVVDAACSVPVTDADLRTVKAYVSKNQTVAKVEKAPPREDRADAAELEEESVEDAELSKKVKAGADRALKAIEADTARRAQARK